MKRSIKPGRSSILDIGAGTGFLSFLAMRLGAREATLIEYSDALDLAEELADFPLHRTDPAPPAGPLDLLPAEHRAVEGELRVVDVLGQVGRVVAEEMGGHISLPGGERRRLDQLERRGQAAPELRLHLRRELGGGELLGVLQ